MGKKSFTIYLFGLLFLICSSCCVLIDKPVFMMTDFEKNNFEFEGENYLINQDSLVIQIDLEVRTPKTRCAKKSKTISGEPHFRILKNLYQDTLYLDLSDTTKIFLQTNQSSHAIGGRAIFGDQFSKPVAIIVNQNVVFSDSQLNSNGISYQFEIPEKFKTSFYPMRIYVKFGYLKDKVGRIFKLNDIKGKVPE